MEPDFWYQKWQEGQIGFHKTSVNRLLVQYLSHLQLARGSRVFVPLCGKTLDIGWLLAQGHRVVGAELSEMAIQQLFDGLGLNPAVTAIGGLKHYQAENIDVYVGDMFDLDRDMLGPVDAVYDRAALVALPEAMRQRYTAHLTAITEAAPQLLLCFEYDQSKMNGPPFSITPAEVERQYGERSSLQLLASLEMVGGLKGQVAATDHVWHVGAG